MRPRPLIKSFVFLLCVLCVFVVKSSAQEPLRTAGDRPIDISHIRLELKVDLPKRTIDAVATLNVKGLRPLTSFALDAVGFEVKKVQSSGHDVPFSHDGNKLVLDCDPPWPQDSEKSLTITYRIHEPKDGLYFFGPTAAEPDVPLTVWSQGEPVSNRYWIPCLDHPNEKQTTELIVTVTEGFEVLSNGRLVSKRTNDDKTVTFHWSQ